MLEVESVSKCFAEVEAVRDVSFSAACGEILGLLGPNGAGKTTTIRMIMGIIRPDRGAIRFATSGRLGPLDKQRVGYLPEERGLYDDTRVLDTLVYFGELKGLLREQARRRAGEWLARMGLSDWADRKIEKLSKGMQQKVQFLAAILHRPDLIVLDEPFAGLDPVHQDLFKEIIRGLRAEGMTILLSSHQMNRVEELCDRIFLVHRGRQVLYGNLEQIKKAHGTHAVRLRFTGDAESLKSNDRIEDFASDGNRATFTLSKGVDPDAFVRSIPAGLVIREIAIERPPLHDVFVKTVSGGDRESA